MSSFKGLFELQSPQDLLKKLHHDYARLQQSPLDQYAAFDFFVTGEHMLDWLYPNDSQKRKHVRDKNVLLQVCSHIANGSKHFVASDKRHVSVKDVRKNEGAFQRDAFQSDAFEVPRLQIDLQGKAARELGESIDAFELAGKVLNFWKNNQEISNEIATS
jgi:hypothetical protein